MGLLVNIDNGGTFTDICLIDKEKVIRAKTLTTPYDLTKCFIEALKAGSKEKYGAENIKALLNETNYIRYSTTVGTNAIVERKGPRIGLVFQKGTDINSLLQSTEEKEMFQALVGERVCDIEIEDLNEKLEQGVVETVNYLMSEGANRIIVSLSGPNLINNEKKIKKIIFGKYPRHLLGAIPVLFSHELSEDYIDKNRTWTALINTFLHPKMESFLYNAENYLRGQRTKNPMLIFHNDGNSARVAKTTAIKTYGSGPRGGMEGAKALAVQYKIPSLVTMDIGGTTTDIGFVQENEIKEKSRGEVEGITTSFSTSDLISIGAGGSSVIKVVNNEVKVGPESVGAAPGPACFARGGNEATITDAYLLMGILNPESYFNGSINLDKDRAQAAIEENIAKPLGISLNEALIAMEKAYVEKIAEGLTVYTAQEEDAILLAFGGAGPMSACGAASASGINSIVIPRYAAIFSSFGINFSDIAHEYQANITNKSIQEVEKQIKELREKAERDMYAEGFDLSECQMSVFVSYESDHKHVKKPYTDQFAGELENGQHVELYLKVVKPIAHFNFENESAFSGGEPNVNRYQTTLNQDGKSNQIPVYELNELEPGMKAVGPAIIDDELFTCRVLEGWNFRINENKDIFLNREGGKY